MIQHPSGRITVVDVNNAGTETGQRSEAAMNEQLFELRKALANKSAFSEYSKPVDPITYLTNHAITSVFRFILTHPDMDHIGGIKKFFASFAPTNFWDTNNTEEKDFSNGGPFDEDDWWFYKNIRDTKPTSNPRRLVYYANTHAQFFNRDAEGKAGGDGLYILAPTRELEAQAQETGDCNDYSYVILYRSTGAKIIFSGDSHNATWEYILKHHHEDVENADVLLAPHHGRDSDRSYDFLDVVKPRLTLFGNAEESHLARDEWEKRKLFVISNNEANCVVIDTNVKPMKIYVTNRAYALTLNVHTTYDSDRQAYYCLEL